MVKNISSAKSSIKDNITTAFLFVVGILGIAVTLSFHYILRQTLAKMGVGLDEAIVRKIILNVEFTTTCIIALSIFIVLLPALFLARRIIQPLRKLQQATEALSSGKLDYRVDITAQDEIGQLTAAFNQMAENLKTAHNELEFEKKSLEQKVRERTQQMEKTNIELKNRTRELEAVNKELESFAYAASHDLKEPLRGIESFSQFLSEDYQDKLDDTGKDYLKRITAGASRMRNLIDDLLTLARISRIKNPYQLVDSGKLIQEAVKPLRAMIEEKNVTLEIDDELPHVCCDPVKMKEVFYNLIANAIKYNDKSEPLIEIGVEGRNRRAEDNSHVTFFIKDNGIGIKEEYFDLIFQIFRRLNSSNKYGGGTGAGLAIVKKIVEEHKGRIWLKSQEGKGSSFFLTIPKKGDQVQDGDTSESHKDFVSRRQ